MAIFERIPAGTAPARPATTTPSAVQNRMRQFESYASEVAAGEVGVLEPEHAETTRSLAMRMSRAATRLGREIETWSADGKLYFKVEGAKKTPSARLELGKKPSSKRS